MSYKDRGFRGQFIGGFNRSDVLEYIKDLSAERNALAEENARLRGQIDSLEEQVRNIPTPEPVETDTQAEPETDGKAREEVDAAVMQADAALDEIGRKYEIICADIEVNTSHMKCEMDSVAERFENLNAALKSAGRDISGLRADLRPDKTEE